MSVASVSFAPIDFFVVDATADPIRSAFSRATIHDYGTARLAILLRGGGVISLLLWNDNLGGGEMAVIDRTVLKGFFLVLAVLATIPMALQAPPAAASGGELGLADGSVIDYDLMDVHPIESTARYGRGIWPIHNPLPGKIHIDDEVFVVDYVDSLGQVFTAQINLTRGTARIMHGAELVSVTTLSQADADMLRLAARDATDPELKFLKGVAIAIIGGIVVAVVVGAWGEYGEIQQCQRDLIAAQRVVANQAAACARNGQEALISRPSYDVCGADGAVSCVPRSPLGDDPLPPRVPGG
jgi:hypothetical protein